LTIANSKNYWFYCYFGEPAISINKAKNFFSSIQFNNKKIKEATYKINSFKKHKVAGKVWYLSPELDYEWSAKEGKEKNKDKLSYPPPPPPPPINKKWLVKANKLASDFSINRSLADKKYKINSWIIVEGIVKEIRETDEHGTTIIILNGAPAKIDVQCEILNSFKIKNLKKGMKAIFDARCAGVNGNVILSKCIYIEKPTYE
jgi:hypothetical protein